MSERKLLDTLHQMEQTKTLLSQIRTALEASQYEAKILELEPGFQDSKRMFDTAKGKIREMTDTGLDLTFVSDLDFSLLTSLTGQIKKIDEALKALDVNWNEIVHQLNNQRSHISGG